MKDFVRGFGWQRGGIDLEGRREGKQGLMAAMFEDSRDGFAEAGEAFLAGSTLAVCAGHIGAIGDERGSVALDDCLKFVVHGFILAAIGGAGKLSGEAEQGVNEAWRRNGEIEKNEAGLCVGYSSGW